jgi:hypothetical protein
MESKFCNKCNTNKSVNDFYLKKDKFIAICKNCRSKNHKIKYLNKNKKSCIQDLENEIWKDVVGYEGIYQISNKQRIKRIALSKIIDNINVDFQERIVKTRLNYKGYDVLNLCKNKERISTSLHRIIAKAFIPNPENKHQVNHINGIRKDNRIENLEWTTVSENVLHSYRKLGKKSNTLGKLNRCGKKVAYYDLLGNLKGTFLSTMDAERNLKVKNTNISAVCLGKKNKTNGYIFKYYNEKPLIKIKNEE